MGGNEQMKAISAEFMSAIQLRECGIFLIFKTYGTRFHDELFMLRRIRVCLSSVTVSVMQKNQSYASTLSRFFLFFQSFYAEARAKAFFLTPRFLTTPILNLGLNLLLEL